MKSETNDAKQAGIAARRLNVPFHQNPYQYSGSKMKAQKQEWDIGWCEEQQREYLIKQCKDNVLNADVKEYGTFESFKED